MFAVRSSLVLMLLVSVVLHADPLYDRLSLFSQGDTVVVDFQQSIWVISVEKKTTDELFFSLVTATKDVLEREQMTSWLTWFEQGFPSASSQEIIRVREKPFHVFDDSPLQSPSTTHKASWISTLFQLELTPLPDSQRKKTGPAPRPGERDFRRVWQPKIIVQNSRVETQSLAYSTTWPDDGSQLSMKKLILYFPHSPKTVEAFPYWIESEGGSYHATVIDSKKGSS